MREREQSPHRSGFRSPAYWLDAPWQGVANPPWFTLRRDCRSDGGWRNNYSFGGAMTGRAMMAVAGFFIGGFLGWFMGVAWYELIEVPRAASMDPVTAPSYLCAAGSALPFLAVPGAVLGAIVGALKNLAG